MVQFGDQFWPRDHLRSGISCGALLCRELAAPGEYLIRKKKKKKKNTTTLLH